MPRRRLWRRVLHTLAYFLRILIIALGALGPQPPPPPPPPRRAPEAQEVSDEREP